jgi:hypothetical protein
MSDFAAIRFLPNRPLLRELSADRLNTILTEIKRNKPKGERGITVRQDGTGTYIGLAASLPRGGGTTTIQHPFKVVLKKIEDAWHWGVIADSKVFTDIFSPVSVDGRLSTQDDNDPGWFPIEYTNGKDYIYLQWDEELLEVTINSAGNGGSFDPQATFPNTGSRLQIDDEAIPTEFEFARKIIASATESEDEDAAPTISQGITSHQILQDICYAGMPAKWFFDYSTGTISG